jgi:hypothetical protein
MDFEENDYIASEVKALRLQKFTTPSQNKTHGKLFVLLSVCGLLMFGTIILAQSSRAAHQV